ncbi:MAG: protein kinase [Myxococcota bacterium]|nr:protein kinase [Myxococcota bacterium]
MPKARRKFKFLKQLSEGTFGRVYMAEMLGENNFSKVVAIKLLHGKWLDHEEIVKRSRDEARVLGLINHPGIIRVDGLTSIDGKCAIIMEYLDGVDLKNLVTYCARNKIEVPVRVCLEVIEQTVSALEAAYYREPLRGGEPLKLIHRDIKPSNIMITVKREIKVLDFGTAQASFSDREARTQALAFGSAPYMAPERIMGEEDHPSGDVFSVGITLFELLSQHRFGKIMYRVEPYEEDLRNRLEFLENHLEGRTLHNIPEKNVSLRKAVIQLLFDVLSYDAPERPDLQALLARCGDLSDQIHDGSLRQFCNDVVQTCRDAFLSENSVVDDPYVIKSDFIIEDMSDVYDQSSPHLSLSPAEVTMPLPEDDKSESSVDLTDLDIEESSVATQMLMSEPSDQYPVKSQPATSASDSFGIEQSSEIVPEPSKYSHPTVDLSTEMEPLNASVAQAPPTVSPSSKQMMILAICAVVLFGVVGLGAVWFALSGGHSDASASANEAVTVVPKTQGMMIDLEHTENAGTVTLTLDRGGAATVRVPIEGQSHEWDGFGSFIIRNVEAGKLKTRFSNTSISTKMMRLEVKPNQKCTYVLYTSRDADSWKESVCQPL